MNEYDMNEYNMKWFPEGIDLSDETRAAWQWHFALGGPHTKWTFEAMVRWGF